MNKQTPVITEYIPKNFGADYCKIRGSEQWPMFAAVALGAKPAYDDWVPIHKYEEFVSICNAYGMVVDPDVLITPVDSPKQEISGGTNITTSFYKATHFNKNAKDGYVHVFVSSTMEGVQKTKRYGWYSVVMNRSFINKPYIDHLRFGGALGYPECCIDFFRSHNNWALYSHPYESYKRTPKSEGKNTGSYYCNNFLMGKSYSLIHHIPCSYRCQKTISLAKQVEKKLENVEPLFVTKAAEMLRKPLLVFGERHFVIFDGILSGSRNAVEISYTNAEYTTNPARKEDQMDLAGTLSEGNAVSITKDHIIIKNNESAIKKIDKIERWFVIGFE